jgi:uncharacterized protein (DUF1015 family)
MATIAPFQPFRYTDKAGRLDDVVTQPYDKISPEMQDRYLAQSPHNLVRVILGKRQKADNDSDNVYTRAAAHLNEWIGGGVLAKDPDPAIYAYFQEFVLPDTGETLTRKGFIALGAVEEYSDGIVHRHEQTLSGPKKDRRDLLEATKSHFGQIFMLYSDPECRVDAILDEASRSVPAADVRDEHGTRHTLYRISDPDRIRRSQERMADKKLLIADGHHRYETALAFRKDHPEMEGAKWVMMTLVNLHSPGLRILATHRVISALPEFDAQTFLKRAATRFSLYKFDTPGALTQLWEQPDLDRIRIAVAYHGADGIYLLTRPRQPGELDVEVLHRELIEGALGISADEVRDGKYLRYVRGMDAALDPVATGDAQISFLVEATTLQQVADCAFNGRCMPQKSTDFYPKLLSGLTIYSIDK